MTFAKQPTLFGTLALLSLLAGSTGCNSSRTDLGQIKGLETSVHDTAPLIADRAEMTAFNPHHHFSAPAPSRLVRTSASRPSRQ